jgi:uncharacterized protein (TIGR01777 family)
LSAAHRRPSGAYGGTRLLVITGATGVVGMHLVRAALSAGYAVRVLTRSPERRLPFGRSVDRIGWDPARAAERHDDAIEPIQRAIDGAAAVVNLAGASLADGRLDDAHRRALIDSRLQVTHALVEGWRRCALKPPVWVQASATGFYGDTGAEDVHETSPPGDLFLSDLCLQWEAAARRVLNAPTRPGEVRLAHARIGLVLAPDAPAWQRLLQPIKLGIGGPLGTGEQWFAWIEADDLARALLMLVDRDDAEGAFNLTSPQPIQQAKMGALIAARLGRPFGLRVPRFALRLATGGLADELLLPSCRALPLRLQQLGFVFNHPDMQSAVDALLPA